MPTTVPAKQRLNYLLEQLVTEYFAARSRADTERANAAAEFLFMLETGTHPHTDGAEAWPGYAEQLAARADEQIQFLHDEQISVEHGA